MDNRWMTTEEIASQYGVSASTVRRWLQERRLRGTRIGKRWLIPQIEGTDLTPEQAAPLLRVSPETVRRWAHDGKLVARREGRRWFIPRDQLIIAVEGTSARALQPVIAAGSANLRYGSQPNSSTPQHPDARIHDLYELGGRSSTAA